MWKGSQLNDSLHIIGCDWFDYILLPRAKDPKEGSDEHRTSYYY